MDKRKTKAKVTKSTAMLLEEPALYYPYELIDTSRNGLSKGFLMKFADQFQYTIREIADILNISERTLHRYTGEAKLSKDASDRALHFIRLYKRGAAVFGTEEAFNQWMKTPNRIFDNQLPMSFLDTTFGFEMLEDELGRIEHGVLA